MHQPAVFRPSEPPSYSRSVYCAFGKELLLSTSISCTDLRHSSPGTSHVSEDDAEPEPPISTASAVFLARRLVVENHTASPALGQAAR